MSIELSEFLLNLVKLFTNDDEKANSKSFNFTSSDLNPVYIFLGSNGWGSSDGENISITSNKDFNINIPASTELHFYITNNDDSPITSGKYKNFKININDSDDNISWQYLNDNLYITPSINNQEFSLKGETTYDDKYLYIEDDDLSIFIKQNDENLLRKHVWFFGNDNSTNLFKENNGSESSISPLQFITKKISDGIISILLGGNGYDEETITISSNEDFEISNLLDNNNYNYNINGEFKSLNNIKSLSININNSTTFHWIDKVNNIIFKPTIDNQVFIINAKTKYDDYYYFPDDLYIQIKQGDDYLKIETYVPKNTLDNYLIISNLEQYPEISDFQKILPYNQLAGSFNIELSFTTLSDSAENVKIYLGGNHQGWWDDEIIEFSKNGDTEGTFSKNFKLNSFINSLDSSQQNIYKNIYNNYYILKDNTIELQGDQSINYWYEDTNKTEPPIQFIIGDDENDSKLLRDTTYTLVIKSTYDDVNSDILICIKQDDQIIHKSSEIQDNSLIVYPAITNRENNIWLNSFLNIYTNLTNNKNKTIYNWTYSPLGIDEDIQIYLGGDGLFSNNAKNISFYNDSNLSEYTPFSNQDIEKINYYKFEEYSRDTIIKRIEFTQTENTNKWLENINEGSNIIIEKKNFIENSKLYIKVECVEDQSIMMSIKQGNQFITIYPVFNLETGWQFFSINDIFDGYKLKTLREYGLSYYTNSCWKYDTNQYIKISDDDALYKGSGYWIKII